MTAKRVARGWSAALKAASSPAPHSVWRRRLAAAIREAAGAMCVSVATCPPAYMVRMQHDTVPERYDALLQRIEAEFAARIDRAGEGWRFAVEKHGTVYAPLETAVYRQLAVELRRAVLDPAGIDGWIVAWFVSSSQKLLGFMVVGTARPAPEVLPLLRGPLAEVARQAALTLETSLELAQGCGVIVPDFEEEGRQSLTAREQQIADLVGQGFSNLNAAARLGISLGTVGVHLRRIYHKLDVHSRVELAAALVRRNPR